MKQIVRNRYLKEFKFSSADELSVFIGNQVAKLCLSIDDTFGYNYYCYICYHSLTKEKEFILSFSSDENEDDFSLLFWNSEFILNTGKKIYLIDERLKIKKSIEITTPLIGMYLINNEKFLLLEEAYMRIVDYHGQVLRSELFDLIEDFSIENDLLFVQTSEENIVIDLNAIN